jgi:S1-C subfamily serine protease
MLCSAEPSRTGGAVDGSGAYNGRMNLSTSALAALSDDIAGTIERVAPGVVAVEARRRVGSAGFFVRPNLILTADHTLESDDIEVVHAGGKAEGATIVGRDASTDLALLRTETAGVPLTFADGAAVRVGALAFAVARDDDGDVAATMGVVSAVGAAWRTWHGGDIDRYIRPDLSLYPRFSGSPLVDSGGAVIGMNTSGLSRRQDITVPGATIMRVVEALVTRGHIAQGYLGIALQHVHLPEGLGGGAAAVVIGVEPQSPANRGGLIVGDVLTGIAGARADVEDLHATIARTAPGAALALDVLRGGAPQSITVTIGERPGHGPE